MSQALLVRGRLCEHCVLIEREKSSLWFLVHLSNRLALTKVNNFLVVPNFKCSVSVSKVLNKFWRTSSAQYVLLYEVI